jgi:molybdate transport system substrate-binding protein
MREQNLWFKHVATFITVVLLALTTRQNAAQAAETILVSAAASLRESLTEIGNRYTKSRPDTTVRFNFASSGTLQQQIERGAPVDVFISAADKQMNTLAEKNLIIHSTRRVLAHNELVLVVPRSSALVVKSFSDLGNPAVRRIALGASASVPAGQYAEQMLRKLSLWSRVQPKAVQGKDVRGVLTQVALGNVDAGLVYRTDAATSPQVRIVKAAPKGSHQPINYPMAVVTSTRHSAAARAFLRHLQSPSAKAILKRRGFVVPR